MKLYDKLSRKSNRKFNVELVMKLYCLTNDNNQWNSQIKPNLNQIGDFSIGYAYHGNLNFFLCMYCNYKSAQNHRDTRIHILSRHCLLNYDVSRKYSKFIGVTIVTAINELRSIIENSYRYDIAPDSISLFNSYKVICDSIKQNGNKWYPKSFPHEYDHTINLDYSEIQLKKKFKDSHSLMLELKQKLDMYRTNSIRIKQLCGSVHYVCAYCEFTSRGKDIPIRKHIITNHCNIDPSHVHDILSLTKLDSTYQSDITNYIQTHKIRHAKSEDVTEISIPIRYSESAFAKCFAHLPQNCLNELQSKLDLLKQYQPVRRITETQSTPTVTFFCCGVCANRTRRLDYMRQHILRNHCNIPSTYMADCLQLCALNKSHRQVNDSKIIGNINRQRSIALATNKGKPTETHEKMIKSHKKSNTASDENSKCGNIKSRLRSSAIIEKIKLTKSDDLGHANLGTDEFVCQFPLDYSVNLLRILCAVELLELVEVGRMRASLECYRSMKVSVYRHRGGGYMYKCSECGFVVGSEHNFIDHVLGRHADVSEQLRPLARRCVLLHHDLFLLAQTENTHH